MAKKHATPKDEPLESATAIKAASPVEGRELWGYGVERLGEGWLAVRVSTRGTVEVLNPLRAGKVCGESRPLAIARALDLFKAELRRGHR